MAESYSSYALCVFTVPHADFIVETNEFSIDLCRQEGLIVNKRFDPFLTPFLHATARSVGAG